MRDGDVDLSELARVLGGFGCSGGRRIGDVDADGNADGDGDRTDLATVLSNSGASCP